MLGSSIARLFGASAVSKLNSRQKWIPYNLTSYRVTSTLLALSTQVWMKLDGYEKIAESIETQLIASGFISRRLTFSLIDSFLSRPTF
jgi:hypothetical protein